MIFKSFLPFCGLSFHLFTFLMVSFAAQKVFFNFDDVQLHTHTHFLVAVPWVFDVICKKALPNPSSQRFTPMFQALTFTSMIHFEFISVYGVTKEVLFYVAKFNNLLLYVFWIFIVRKGFCTPRSWKKFSDFLGYIYDFPRLHLNLLTLLQFILVCSMRYRSNLFFFFFALATQLSTTIY